MTNIAILAALLSLATLSVARAAGPPPSAGEVLDKVAGVYSHLSSIRVSVRWSQAVMANGQSRIAESEYELAAQGKSYFLRLKENGVEAVAASDGENIWKALVSSRQWSRIEAATAAGDEDDESAPEPRDDRYSLLAGAVFRQYPRLAKTAQDAAIVREADYKLTGPGGAKVRCYVLRLRTGTTDQELWIDKERFLVLQRLQKMRKANGATEVRMQFTAIAINEKIPDSAFRLQPAKGWSEVEMVLIPGEESPSLAGSRAANFTLKNLDGQNTDLDQARGKVVVLDFWATWCEPCRRELPSIEKLRAEFGDKVVIYGINDEDAGTAKDFVRKNRYEMTVLMDTKRQVIRQYGVWGFPTLMIIDREGFIRKLYVGGREEATLRESIQSVVASK